MAEISGGELLLRCLNAQGVRYIHAIPDGTYNIMLEPLQRLPEEFGCKLIVPRHEAAAAHMADAYTRVSGEPAVVMACAGPGAANLVSGVITAQAESSPIVAITTTRRTEIAHPDSGGMQVTDQFSYFQPVVKWSARVQDWKRIPSFVHQAFGTAVSGRPGPVHLQIPENLLAQKGDPDSVSIPEKWGSAVPVADPSDIRRTAELLVNATLPNLHLGRGALQSGAGAEARALAEHLGCPITTSPSGRGTVPEDHELSIHPLCAAAAMIHNVADVVLVVGAGLGELDFWGRPPVWAEPSAQKLIQLDVEAARIGLRRPAEVALVGDARRTLAELLEAVKALTPKRVPHARMAEFRDIQKQWRRELDASVADDERRPLLTGSLFRILDEVLGREAILAMDGGNTCLWGVHHHEALESRALLWTSNFGHLGTGLPYAIGAKLARPDRNVYCVTGDGAFGFHMQELETAVRHELPILVVVAADGAWGMEKTSQNRVFGRSGDWLGCGHAPVRYDRLAEAMGCHGEFVESGGELRAAIPRALASGKPAVIHAAVDPVANVDPPGVAIWAASHAAS